MINENPYNVKVGQIWVDNDPRHGIRKLKVLSIILDNTKVLFDKINKKLPDAYARVIEVDSYFTPVTKGFYVKLSRFNGHANGYKLEKEFVEKQKYESSIKEDIFKNIPK